jgi:hypothetical protein
MERLRDIADPYFAGMEPKRLSGGAGMSRYGVEARQPAPASQRKDGQTEFQGAVSPMYGSAASLTTTAVVSPDRRFVRLSMNPVFIQGIGSPLLPPMLNFSSIPGGTLP